MKNQAWRIDLPNVGKAITDVESVANWYREHGCEVVELVDRESNHEKDKRIAELEAITNVQLETITDLENRLEALQSSQSQVSEAVKYDLSLDAYYYGFDQTGVLIIDRILSAVACAGKAFHHTRDWCDDATQYDGHKGQAPIDWIQNAANDAASALQPSTPDKKGGE